MLILAEHTMPYTHYDRCGQQVAPWLLRNWHFVTAEFRAGRERLQKWETLQRHFTAHQVVLNVNMNPLDSTEAFAYPGRKVTYNNTNWLALYANLRKMQKLWGVVEKYII